MKRLLRAATAASGLMVLCWVHAQRPSDKAAADTAVEVYRQCRRLESDLDSSEERIEALEYEIGRTRTAIANYTTVRQRNDEVIAGLRRWASAEQ